MISRRAVIVSAAAATGIAGIAAARFAWQRFAPLPAFEPLTTPPGFRRIAVGASSVGLNPLVGLDAGQQTAPQAFGPAAVSATLCASLYPDLPEAGDLVPIASFSDYYCPYCRVQTKQIARIAADRPDAVSISWHELPLLGDPSALAARAALAAHKQGAYLAFQDRLLSTPFRATPGYLAVLAEDIGVDADELLADMDGTDVTRQLQTSAALSKLFGFVGTPALVIGRTVVQGKITDATLLRLIALERAEGWRQICSAAG